MKCSVEGCDKKHAAKGFCQNHWRRNDIYGSPLGGRTPNGVPLKHFNEAILAQSDDCFLWPYSKDRNGYSTLKINRKNVHLHVMACEHRNGPRPTDKHQAAHNCGNGNKGCYNPLHMRWATAKENHADKIIHGTMISGEISCHAKLSLLQASEIYSLKGIEPQSKIAKKYGISQQQVSKIQRLERWVHDLPKVVGGTGIELV
jgi:hypothetical protein